MKRHTLIQLGYVCDGIYTYQCADCHKKLDIAYTRISDFALVHTHEIQKPSVVAMPHHFPIQHCWHCGVKFNQCLWQHQPKHS